MSVLIRDLLAHDLPRLAATDGGPAWNPDPALWADYLRTQRDGLRVVRMALEGEALAGYGTLLWRSGYPPFAEAGIPEINNLVVAQAARGRGVATALIASLDAAARQAGRREIGLGVGLYADYGPAQRLYVRLGYRPDGRGLTQGVLPAAPDAQVRVDDDLLLWFSKPLR